jgi:hypothetical protein
MPTLKTMYLAASLLNFAMAFTSMGRWGHFVLYLAIAIACAWRWGVLTDRTEPGDYRPEDEYWK